jgi:hypothetical protein
MCASSSTATSASTSVIPTGKNKITKKIIDAATFIALINSDEEWHMADIEPYKKYSLTIGNIITTLQNVSDIAIDATVIDYNTLGAKIRRQEPLCPVLFALQDASRHQAAIAIAQAFPNFINTTDSKGNTALHYYCASNPPNVSDFPQILKLFKQQLNIPNKRGFTPIQMARQSPMLLALYIAGARLDEQTIDMCSPYWKKNESILGTLHALKFDINVLATKFELDTVVIEKASNDLKLTSHSGVCLLLSTIQAKDYKHVITIAEKYPRLIDVTDPLGKTPLHYLANQNATLGELNSHFPQKLKQLFGHQVNTPCNKGITPIFHTSQPHILIALYAMGAQLDIATVIRRSPMNWRTVPMLVTLAHLGFPSKFLATTFAYNELEIKEGYKNYRQHVRHLMRTMGLGMSQTILGSSKIWQQLTLRDQYGRSTKHAFLTQARHKQSTKRLQRTNDEPTDTAKCPRTS